MKHEESAPQVQVGVELAEVDRKMYDITAEAKSLGELIEKKTDDLHELCFDYLKLTRRREELLARGRTD